MQAILSIQAHKVTYKYSTFNAFSKYLNSMNSSQPKRSQVSFVEITEIQAGQRIDNFLITYLKDIPKSHVYRILRRGEIRVNKKRTKPTYRIQIGDIIRLPPLQHQEREAILPNLNQVRILEHHILYQDERMLVLDKPAGMAVHGGSGISFGVIESLRALYPHAPFLELVHRLDRETSGCLMIAKKRSVLRELHTLLRDGKINKQYTTLVKGHWPRRQHIVDLPLAKNYLQSGERIVRVSEEGKAARTRFEVLKTFANATLLRATPITGRTHQIRVHAAQTNHPIAGDDKYGHPIFNQTMADNQLKRLFLHASKLHIPDMKLTFESPLPVELKTVLQNLN